MHSHLFLFQPGMWEGQGIIQVTGVSDALKFYTWWTIDVEADGQSICATQKVEIKASNHMLTNFFKVSLISANAFKMLLHNAYLQESEGIGHVDASAVMWKFDRPEQQIQGFEICHLQPDGSYQCQAEFTTDATSCTKVSYTLHPVP